MHINRIIVILNEINSTHHKMCVIVEISQRIRSKISIRWIHPPPKIKLNYRLNSHHPAKANN